MSRYVLDTSALMALRRDEPGADRVDALLRQAQGGEVTALASFMTRMEVAYLVTQKEGEEAAATALRMLDAMAMEWVSCEAAVLESAARIKAGGKISVADAWIAATARVREAVLVHADPEFLRLESIAQEPLRPLGGR